MSEKKSDPKKIASDLESCLKEKQEYLDGWKRAKADLLNYKKEETERTTLMLKYSLEGFMHDLLFVLDSFDLAMQTLRADKNKEGFRMIQGQFQEVLKRNGLEIIEVAKGDDFNEAEQESIAEEVGEENLNNKVVEVMAKGYRLNGKILRAVKVKIGRTK